MQLCVVLSCPILLNVAPWSWRMLIRLYDVLHWLNIVKITIKLLQSPILKHGDSIECVTFLGFLMKTSGFWLNWLNDVQRHNMVLEKLLLSFFQKLLQLMCSSLNKSFFSLKVCVLFYFSNKDKIYPTGWKGYHFMYIQYPHRLLGRLSVYHWKPVDPPNVFVGLVKG